LSRWGLLTIVIDPSSKITTEEKFTLLYKEQKHVPLPRVLIISDNTESAVIWENALRRRSIEVIHLAYRARYQNLSLPEFFDLVLIDSNSESETALAICGLVRTKSDKPILLLTCEPNELYQLKAYQAGVDECVVTPVSVLIFLAKIKVWLHRASVMRYESGEISASGFRTEPRLRRVFTPDGKSIRLSVLEFRLLSLFLANPGHVLETDFLLSRVWNHNPPTDRKLLFNLVYRLRRKIEPHSPQGKHIRLITDQGYMWETDGFET
jgi:DNA-binding response OmpR family regulator